MPLKVTMKMLLEIENTTVEQIKRCSGNRRGIKKKDLMF